jgi:hypothetical protein
MISGNGNFPLVTAPDIEWPAGIEVTEPLVKEELNKFAYPLQGSKIFEYNFSSRDTGNFSIPAVEFSFFDPSLKKYVSKKSSVAAFRIKKGIKSASSPVRAVKHVVIDPPLPMYWYWFGMMFIGIGGYLIYFYWTRHKSRKIQAAPVPTVKVQKQPENIFEDPFNLARHALYKGDKKTFYTEVQRVLWKTVAEKCDTKPSALNKQNIITQLRNCQVPEDTISELQYILNECEWAVYTPSVDEKDMNKILSAAQRIRKSLNAE